MSRLGKQFRLTLEGQLLYDHDQKITLEVAGVQHTFGPRVQGSPGFKLEEIEPPLAVGDSVIRIDRGFGVPTGKIVAVFDHRDKTWAVVDFSPSAPSEPIELRNLKRVT